MFLLAGLSIVHWNLDAATFNKLQPFRKKTQMLLCHTGPYRILVCCVLFLYQTGISFNSSQVPLWNICTLFGNDLHSVVWPLGGSSTLDLTEGHHNYVLHVDVFTSSVTSHGFQFLLEARLSLQRRRGGPGGSAGGGGIVSVVGKKHNMNTATVTTHTHIAFHTFSGFPSCLSLRNL